MLLFVINWATSGILSRFVLGCSLFQSNMEFLNNRPTYQKMLGGVFIIDICCCALLLANLLDNPSTPINAFMGLVSYSLTVVAIIFMQLISCVLNLFGSYLHVTEARSSSTKRAAILSLATLTIAFLIILLRGAPERFAAMRSVEIATKTGLALTMSISHIAFVFALKQDQFRFRLDRRHMLDFPVFERSNSWNLFSVRHASVQQVHSLPRANISCIVASKRFKISASTKLDNAFVVAQESHIKMVTWTLSIGDSSFLKLRF